MNSTFLRLLLFVAFFFVSLLISVYSQNIIIDHTCTDIRKIPLQAIINAKAALHISYGHTSHGSQLTTGMSGLVAFANNGGKGLSLPQNIFAWNNGGINGALDLKDGVGLPGDVGYYPDWVNSTRNLLTNPQYAYINVIMWSWCGQVTAKYTSGKLYSEYFNPMAQLERDFPNVKFVYMTGHVDHGADADNKAANKAIRDYCRANNKILFDFADIESYNPDGVFFEFTSDACDYYSSTGTRLGNWATEWQNNHLAGIDWFNCSSAHSEPLNANQKAYAAWWLFARLAGWSGTVSIENSENITTQFMLKQNYPNPFNPSTTIEFYLPESGKYSLKVFNLFGQEVAEPADKEFSAGVHKVSFDAGKLASGTYIYQLLGRNLNISKKMILIK